MKQGPSREKSGETQSKRVHGVEEGMYHGPKVERETSVITNKGHHVELLIRSSVAHGGTLVN